VVVLMWLLCAPKRAACIDPIFVSWRYTRGQNPLKTFSMVWEQYFTKVNYIWMDWQVKNGSTSVTGAEWPGWPSICTACGNTEWACAIILNNTRVTFGDMENHSWFNPWNYPQHTSLS
jgi:hypothetical protein